MKTAALFFAIALATQSVLAKDQSVENACKDADSGSYTAIYVCLAAMYRADDAELNETYRNAILATKESPNPKRVKNALITAQRAWVVYRDRSCELSSLLAGYGYEGPHRPSSCMSDLTKKRIVELKAYISCLNEGGSACPWP